MKRRIHEEDEVGELNIVPYLDIITNLVMFMLLSMTGLIGLGVLDVSAPKIGGENAVTQQADPNAPKLLLTVAISRKGFYVAGSGGVLGGPADADVVYDILIQTMDACRGQAIQLPDGKSKYSLFPLVSLSLIG